MKVFIKQRLVEKGKTVSELAWLIGISRQSLCESLERDMRISTVYKVADALGYDLVFRDRKTGEEVAIEKGDVK